MHIIFGDSQAQVLADKYTVLELDTFQLASGLLIKAYCTVETIPIEELSMLDAIKKQHSDLLINYSIKNWSDCLTALKNLKGKWRGELDTFYKDLESRINGYIINPPPANWSPIIVK
jgi:hypothetical protein